jgi:5'-methylthioadenosine phosphorylase
MTTAARADIAVVGGSGFYSLLDDAREVVVETPYGDPSDAIVLAELDGRTVAFLPRHGRSHTVPPHQINYRANIWALKSLGVKVLISPCAAGSLQPHVKPEHFVVLDQYVDRTRGRMDTFFEGPDVYHVSAADPYCPHLRRIATGVIKGHGIEVHETGTIVVINGPRFSTKAESKWFSSQGWEVIGMTQYPEVALALELEIAPLGIALITDYDSGLFAEGLVAPCTTEEIYAVFSKNAHRIKAVVLDIIRAIPVGFESPCHRSLQFAKVGV